mgnify:CR=1 FL=1
MRSKTSRRKALRKKYRRLLSEGYFYENKMQIREPNRPAPRGADNSEKIGYKGFICILFMFGYVVYPAIFLAIHRLARLIDVELVKIGYKVSSTGRVVLSAWWSVLSIYGWIKYPKLLKLVDEKLYQRVETNNL